MQECTVRELLLWLLRRRRRYRVVGSSMYPALDDGDEVLLDPHAYQRRPPGNGDIVVAGHPQLPGLQIIKRVRGVASDGRLQLRGDNPDPLAQSDFRLPIESIRGRVTSRFWSSRSRENQSVVRPSAGS